MRLVLKWRKAVIAAVAFIIAAQVSASLLVRLETIHSYLQAGLGRAFGRPVLVRRFTVSLFPRPVLDAEEVTVSEDPEFGSEYFLRAERLTAGLRWAGLLKGHFEFGTFSLSHASLILVRNRAGSWNMERWLPPASSTLGLGNRFYGPQRQSSPSNHLQQIEVNDGRINFKLMDEKAPFAFVGVSGKVEQVSAGRWHLELEAQPWSSGVALQSAGTLLVRGDVAGTSARLQPAEIHVHWGRVSLADLFRLLRGQDYGVRGVFALDATAKSDGANVPAGYQAGDWRFLVQVHAEQIHRWDLSERVDDPAVNVNLRGRWNTIARNGLAERFTLETPKSNLRGSARFDSSTLPSWEVRVDSAGVQAADILAWYRAFDPNVSNVIETNGFLTGAFTMRGWPFALQDAAFSSSGGELRIAGADSPVQVGAFQGGRNRESLTIGPIPVSYGSKGPRDATNTVPDGATNRNTGDRESALQIYFQHNFNKHEGTVSLDGHLERTEDVLKLLTALGKPVNHGWDLNGPSELAMSYRWDMTRPAGWSGHVDFEGDSAHVAGLNLPLQVHKARLAWNDGLRTLRINGAEAFGTTWSGQFTQLNTATSSTPVNWSFQLRANHLDAADVDSWINPRAKPGWLERLLPSLIGSSSASSESEFLHRLNADGELRVDEFVLGKIRFNQVRASAGMRDFHLDFRQTDARLAGGKMHARVRASFLPHSSYEVAADLDELDLKQLSLLNNLAARFAGRASGVVHLNTEGSGRDELLKNLTGKGEINLKDLEFEGWDANAAMANGEPREGASHWSSGQGVFQVRGPSIAFPALRLEAGAELNLLRGTLSFAQGSDFTIEPVVDEQVGITGVANGYVLKISGSVDVPRVSIERLVARHRE
jgi:AsmA-like protein